MSKDILHNAKILLIDDDEAILQVIKYYFDKEGCKVSTATDGVMGLEIYSRMEPDIIITDLCIPELNGTGLLFAIKKISPETPVIIVSGVADKKDIIEVMRLGAADFIEKPILDMEFLKDSVRKNLSLRQRLREGRLHQKELEIEVDRRTAELIKRVSEIEILNEALKRELLEHELAVTELEVMRDGVIKSIATIGEQRDPYTAGHQLKVSKLGIAIARELKLSEDQIECIRIAGLLHDIGKISIPAEILNRPGALKKSEMNLIKDHSLDGYNILKRITFPWPVAELVYQHHERLDGSGYPRQLKGDEILMESRILSLADVVDAIASHRPYREALGEDFALKEIENKKDIYFDPVATDACIKIFKNGFNLQH
ncbi:MAG: response regulator [Spirochaetales bacterium]|nr:response regulator [Spirochaetales bacterium]